MYMNSGEDNALNTIYTCNGYGSHVTTHFHSVATGGELKFGSNGN